MIYHTRISVCDFPSFVLISFILLLIVMTFNEPKYTNLTSRKLFEQSCLKKILSPTITLFFDVTLVSDDVHVVSEQSYAYNIY